MSKPKQVSAPSLINSKPTHAAPDMLLRLDAEASRQAKQSVKSGRGLAWKWLVFFLLIGIAIFRMTGQADQPDSLIDLSTSKKVSPPIETKRAKPLPVVPPNRTVPSQFANLDQRDKVLAFVLNTNLA